MEKDKYQILEDWHKLLKTGTITEEEFKEKKSELLGYGNAQQFPSQKNSAIANKKIQNDIADDLLLENKTWFSKNKSKAIAILIPLLLVAGGITWYFSDYSRITNVRVEKEEFDDLITKWNNAHNSKDISALQSLYDDSILFYGTKRTKNDCIENIANFCNKNPSFHQQIFDSIRISNLDDNKYKCSFLKQVVLNDQTKYYPSYLIFSKKNDVWKIIVESDSITDKNLAKLKGVKIPKNAVKGDFNGDGILDYCWLIKPKIDTDGMSCIGDCVSYITFSDLSIPRIKVDNCIDGIPTNLGDLNKDGKDEIGLLPGWFTSCWRDYNVYTLKYGKWEFAVPPFPTHCNQWEEGITPIEVDPNSTGKVLIHYSENTGIDIVIKTKSIPIN